jgi:hypothetical protein
MSTSQSTHPPPEGLRRNDHSDGRFFVIVMRLIAVIFGKATRWQWHMDGFVEVEQVCFIEVIVVNVHVLS